LISFRSEDSFREVDGRVRSVVAVGS